MHLFQAKAIINLLGNVCGGIKFARNLANERLSLKFFQGIFQILLEQYF